MMMMTMIVFWCCVCVDYIANDKLVQHEDVAQCLINCYRVPLFENCNRLIVEK